MLYYLHIPKSAGTSVRSLFNRVYGNRLVEVYRGIDAQYVRELAAICHPDSVLFGHYSFSLHRRLGDAEPRYMTILRHPVQRVISWYKSALRDPQSRAYRKIQRDHLTLAEAVERGIAPEVNNHSVRALAGNDRRWQWKYDFLNRYSSRFLGKHSYQFNGRRYLDAAVANLNNFFGFVGIADRLDLLTQYLRLRGELPLGCATMPHENVTPPMDLAVDSQTIAVIEKANELDMLLYEKVAARLQADGEWYPVEAGPRTLRSRVNEARLAIPHEGAPVAEASRIPKRMPPAPETDLLKPILIAGCGRTGGTALISLLATDRRVVVDRAYRQLENRYLTYLAKWVLLMTRREPAPTFKHDELFGFEQNWIGPYPWSRHPNTIASRAAALPDRFDTWLRLLWKTFADEVRAGYPEARFYAEKPPSWVAPQVRDAVGAVTLYLMRDPRDSYISANAFMKKRDYLSFTREAGDTDVDHARSLTHAFLDYFENYWMDRHRADCLLVRYEELIVGREELRQRLERHLGLHTSWDALARLDEHTTASDPARSINRWQREPIAPEVCRYFEKYLRAEMAHMGYPFSPGAQPEPFPAVEFRAGALDLVGLKCSADGWMEPDEEYAKVTVRGPDFWMILPWQSFDAAAWREVWVSLRTMVGDTCSLYWRGPDEDFSEERVIHIPCWPGRHWQVLRFRGAGHPLWKDTIAGLRLDIFNIHHHGMPGTGLLRWARLVE
jgi:hypothetical protein